MKRIAIITIHFGMNHGSALQTYALSHYLADSGYRVNVIDYIPPRYGIWDNLYEKKRGKYPLLIIIAAYFMKLPRITYQRKLFSNFLKNNVQLTKTYRTNTELHNSPPEADIYLTGSDQVWNCDYNTKGDYSYFLDFAPKGKDKVAYAASFGKELLTQEEIAKYSPFLREYNFISVRESSGLKLLTECGVKGQVSVDPTLLLTKAEWLFFASNVKRRKKEKYVLVYVMDGLYEKLLQCAMPIANKLNCKVFVVAFKKIKDKRIDKCFFNINPKEFVSMVANSEFVVTNSFHGTAFSVNLNKQFIAVAKSKYNTRITSLLDMVGLTDRFITDEKQLVEQMGVIDFDAVNSRLEAQRSISREFLLNSIDNIKKV